MVHIFASPSLKILPLCLVHTTPAIKASVRLLTRLLIYIATCIVQIIAIVESFRLVSLRIYSVKRIHDVNYANCLCCLTSYKQYSPFL